MFLALGTVRWMLRELTAAMGHADALDQESLTRELLAGAHAWQIGDWASAVNRLRAGFEVMTQARERFYPVDAYLLDLCLLDPAVPAEAIADSLGSPIAISFIAQRKQSKIWRCTIRNGWRRSSRRLPMAGPTSPAVLTPKRKTRSYRWNRFCGSSGEDTTSIASISTIAMPKHLRAALRPVQPTSSDRQTVRISLRAPSRARRGPVSGSSRDQAALGEP